jgi:hypothetical protein
MPILDKEMLHTYVCTCMPRRMLCDDCLDYLVSGSGNPPLDCLSRFWSIPYSY